MRKIIRNKIPMIAKQNGNRKNMNEVTFGKHQLEPLFQLLKEKIIEEANEVMEAKNDIDLKYELCDLLQAIDDFLIVQGISDTEIETIMKAKAFTNGTFIKVIQIPINEFDTDKRVEVEAYILDDTKETKDD